MKNQNLVGRKVRIISDNENYTKFINQTLVCTFASNSGNGYDDSCFPEMLCDFKTLQGKKVPFALYEYEFEVI